MDIKITPGYLHGDINVPPSKSLSHRALICAALANGTSRIKNTLDCVDTEATIEVLSKLGAEIIRNGNDIIVHGISKKGTNFSADCRESGSTLRFLIPVAAALGASATFNGHGKLPERPITPYFTELTKNGIIFHSEKMPYVISGQLKAGSYFLAGDISSQFVSGLLFALPLLDGNSEIVITSPLQSKPYVDITIDCMRSFGVEVVEEENGYFVKGNQQYKPTEYTVEADMSQAAFFLVANAIGANLNVLGMNKKSMQGDSAILQITQQCGGKAFDVDASQIPDLVPILAVLATFCEGVSHITNCGRLRIKECDRLAAISTELNKLGAKVEELPDSLTITGVKSLHGGVCNSHNDHRIPMALAIASQRCIEPLTIIDAKCVSKSYPEFWEDFTAIGGKFDVVNLSK